MPENPGWATFPPQGLNDPQSGLALRVPGRTLGVVPLRFEVPFKEPFRSYGAICGLMVYPASLGYDFRGTTQDLAICRILRFIGSYDL